MPVTNIRVFKAEKQTLPARITTGRAKRSPGNISLWFANRVSGAVAMTSRMMAITVPLVTAGVAELRQDDAIELLPDPVTEKRKEKVHDS